MSRWFAVVALLAVSTVVGSTGAFAQEEEAPPQGASMYFDVGNPAPGDTIHVGAMNIEGIAFDRLSEDGPGIDHIDVFFENRDEAGILIGRAGLGVPTPAADDPAVENSGWSAQVTLEKPMTGLHTLFFYAFSGVTGEESVVAVPVNIAP